MHPADITATLRKAGSSQAKVARKLGITRTTVSQVVRGTGKSRRVQQAISRASGVPVTTLWPQAKQVAL